MCIGMVLSQAVLVIQLLLLRHSRHAGVRGAANSIFRPSHSKKLLCTGRPLDRNAVDHMYGQVHAAKSVLPIHMCMSCNTMVNVDMVKPVG